MEKQEVKCIFCGGKATQHFEDLSLFEGKVLLKGEPYFKCSKCKREYVTRHQMQETEKKLGSFYITRPVISTGRSLAITLPPGITEFYSIKKGTEVRLIPEDKNTLKIKLQ